MKDCLVETINLAFNYNTDVTLLCNISSNTTFYYIDSTNTSHLIQNSDKYKINQANQTLTISKISMLILDKPKINYYFLKFTL